MTQRPGWVAVEDGALEWDAAAPPPPTFAQAGVAAATVRPLQAGTAGAATAVQAPRGRLRVRPLPASVPAGAPPPWVPPDVTGLLARGGYSHDEVVRALTEYPRRVEFRYEVLDHRNRPQGWLDGVQSGGTIEQNALAEVHRTMSLTVDETSDVDWLNDRIRPWMRVYVPPRRPAAVVFPPRVEPVDPRPGWIEWPLGVFLPVTPIRDHLRHGTYRTIDGYDQGQILNDHHIDTRLYLPAGTHVVGAVEDLLAEANIEDVRVDPSPHTLPNGRDWEPGTSIRLAVNDLLDAIGYEAVWFDALGAAIARPYRSPQEVAPLYTYRDDAQGVMLPDFHEELDLWSVANRWTLVVSEPDEEPLVATYSNVNPDSPTSIPARRGRIIDDFRQDDSEQAAVSQEVLDAKVLRLAEEASQVFEAVEFTTDLMPIHDHATVVELAHSRLGGARRYREHTWSMTLATDGTHHHRVRRVVVV